MYLRNDDRAHIDAKLKSNMVSSTYFCLLWDRPYLSQKVLCWPDKRKTCNFRNDVLQAVEAWNSAHERDLVSKILPASYPWRKQSGWEWNLSTDPCSQYQSTWHQEVSWHLDTSSQPPWAPLHLCNHTCNQACFIDLHTPPTSTAVKSPFTYSSFMAGFDWVCNDTRINFS